LIYTTTINNQVSITTVPAAIVAATATASGDGLTPDDVSIAFSPKLLDVLNNLAEEAEIACAARRKRQTCNANERFAQRVAEELEPGGAFDFVEAEVLATLPTVTAGDVARILNGARVPIGSAVSVFLTWKVMNGLKAFTISSTSLTGGGVEDDEDKCPADAPQGDKAVSRRSTKRDTVSWLRNDSLAVQTIIVKGIRVSETRNAQCTYFPS
jgi:hypothetical protein